MLSDFHPKGAVSQLYGSYNEQYGRGRRSVYLIDSAGVLQWKRIYQTGLPDLEEVLAEVARLA
jgi:alkyl hydroperoxide reductase subunit AhpC